MTPLPADYTTPPPRKSRATLLLIVIVVLAGLYYAASYFKQAGGPPGGVPEVSIAEVIERDVHQWREFSGLLVAVDQVDVRPQVSGQIYKIHFTDGAMVKKGDMLFTIDPRPYQAALEAAQAHAQLADSEFTRAERLIADKAIPQHDYDQRKNDTAVANADLTKAKLDLAYTAIRSPITGRAGRAEITVGNLVDTGGSAPVLTSVVSISPIYADFEVDEHTFLEYIGTHATSQQDVKQIPVTIALADGSTPHEGHIQSFDNRLNPASGTLRVRAIFDNQDGALVPGLFARVRLGSAEDLHAILVAEGAIGTDQNKKTVLVVGADNKVEYREVKLGPIVNGLRVITDGLKAGEKIVVSGLQRAHPGAPVKPTVVPMDPKDVTPAQAGAQAQPAAEK